MRFLADPAEFRTASRRLGVRPLSAALAGMMLAAVCTGVIKGDGFGEPSVTHAYTAETSNNDCSPESKVRKESVGYYDGNEFKVEYYDRQYLSEIPPDEASDIRADIANFVTINPNQATELTRMIQSPEHNLVGFGYGTRSFEIYPNKINWVPDPKFEGRCYPQTGSRAVIRSYTTLDPKINRPISTFVDTIIDRDGKLLSSYISPRLSREELRTWAVGAAADKSLNWEYDFEDPEKGHYQVKARRLVDSTYKGRPVVELHQYRAMTEGIIRKTVDFIHYTP
jgi:hypothetical protein